MGSFCLRPGGAEPAVRVWQGSAWAGQQGAVDAPLWRAVAAVHDGYVLRKSVHSNPMGGRLLSQCMQVRLSAAMPGPPAWARCERCRCVCWARRQSPRRRQQPARPAGQRAAARGDHQAALCLPASRGRLRQVGGARDCCTPAHACRRSPAVALWRGCHWQHTCRDHAFGAGEGPGHCAGPPQLPSVPCRAGTLPWQLRLHTAHVHGCVQRALEARTPRAEPGRAQVAADIKETTCRTSDVPFSLEANLNIPTVTYEVGRPAGRPGSQRTRCCRQHAVSAARVQLPDGNELQVGPERFNIPEILFRPVSWLAAPLLQLLLQTCLMPCCFASSVGACRRGS